VDHYLHPAEISHHQPKFPSEKQPEKQNQKHRDQKSVNQIHFHIERVQNIGAFHRKIPRRRQKYSGNVKAFDGGDFLGRRQDDKREPRWKRAENEENDIGNQAAQKTFEGFFCFEENINHQKNNRQGHFHPHSVSDPDGRVTPEESQKSLAQAFQAVKGVKAPAEILPAPDFVNNGRKNNKKITPKKNVGQFSRRLTKIKHQENKRDKKGKKKEKISGEYRADEKLQRPPGQSRKQTLSEHAKSDNGRKAEQELGN